MRKISIGLIMIMFFSAFPIYSFAENTGFFLALEAENGISDSSVKGHFIKISDGAASGGYAMQSASYEQGFQAASQAPLKFCFNTGTDGKYKIFIRYKASGSVKYSVNSSAYTPAWFVFDDNSYKWSLLDDVNMNAGLNEISFSNRMMYFTLDKIIITDSIFFFPVGFGQLLSEGSGLDCTYPSPSEHPKIGVHPRVMINRSDITRIRAGLYSQENLNAYNKLIANAELNRSGILAQVEYNNYDIHAMDCAQANALLYQLTGKENYAEKAVGIMLNYLATVRYYPTGTSMEKRGIGGTIYSAALIYDWCHDASCFTAWQKSKMTELVLKNASLLDCGWPSTKLSAFDSGYGWENSIVKDLFSYAIAIYDEHPEIYAFVGGRIFSEFIPAANFHYENKSSFHRSGDDYGIYRLNYELYLNLLLNGMGCDNIISKNQQSAALQAIIRMRPDGERLNDGDNWTNLASSKAVSGSLPLIAAYLFKDPYMKQLFFEENPEPEKITNSITDLSLVMYLCLNDISIGRKSRENMPLSSFGGKQTGVITARTGWDENSAVVSMKLPERYGGGHSHLDAGGFEIYYKGALALDSGMYQSASWTDENGNAVTNLAAGSEHDINYHKRTIAHNSMLIYDPKETGFGIGTANDGGQKVVANYPWNTTTESYASKSKNSGRIISYSCSQSHSYMRGDIGGWYSDKVENYERSFLFYNFSDITYPGALIVFDKVKSSNASYKKTWLLHSQEQPVVCGNTVTIKRTGNGCNGRLINTTLLPENNTKCTVGGDGFEYYVNGKNYTAVPNSEAADESGNYRVEISPVQESENDCFLNVLQISDNNDEITPLEVKLLKESKDFYGAEIKNKIAYFYKGIGKINSTFTVGERGEGNMEYSVCGVSAGLWKISSQNASFTAEVSEDGGILDFCGEKTEYNITKLFDAPTVLAMENYFSDYKNVAAFGTVNNSLKYKIKEFGLIKSHEREAELGYSGLTAFKSNGILNSAGQFGILLKDDNIYLGRSFMLRPYLTYINGENEQTIYGDDIFVERIQPSEKHSLSLRWSGVLRQSYSASAAENTPYYFNYTQDDPGTLYTDVFSISGSYPGYEPVIAYMQLDFSKLVLCDDTKKVILRLNGTLGAFDSAETGTDGADIELFSTPEFDWTNRKLSDVRGDAAVIAATAEKVPIASAHFSVGTGAFYEMDITDFAIESQKSENPIRTVALCMPPVPSTNGRNRINFRIFHQTGTQSEISYYMCVD